MEITGQRISIPRNFFFLNRLPTRFEVLVIAKGAVVPRGTAFELKIQGQRLVLHSKIDLKVGARYELEKFSALEFKILSEKSEEKPNLPSEPKFEQTRKSESEPALDYFPMEGLMTAQDLLALKVLNDSAHRLEKKEEKFLFDWESELGLKGVFVPQGAGKYRLFVTGSGVSQNDLQSLATILSEVGVVAIRHVNRAVLDSIAAGAVDIQS